MWRLTYTVWAQLQRCLGKKQDSLQHISNNLMDFYLLDSLKLDIKLLEKLTDSPKKIRKSSCKLIKLIRRK